MNNPGDAPIDETSIRYEGWRIVAVCFLVATFGWAMGFYGQSVYVAELHRLHGWPTSLISTATTCFYLFGALLVAFVSEAIRAFGPRNCMLAGVLAMAAATALLGQIVSPWQLYVVNALLAFGWAGTSLGMITNTLGLWFDTRRGMAISLALNGASFGGIVGVPLMVAAIGHFGFAGAMAAGAVATIVLLIPVILIFVGRPPDRAIVVTGSAADAPSATRMRALAFRDIAFSDRVRRVRAGVVRAGWLYCSSDFVSGSRYWPRTCGCRRRAVDGDGGGGPVAVLNGDRSAKPAACLCGLLCKSGLGADDPHQFAE